MKYHYKNVKLAFKLILLIVFLTVPLIGQSLDLVWNGTGANKGGDWNNRFNWRIGSLAGTVPAQAPRSFDNCYFYDGSIDAGAVITIDQNSNCHDLLFFNSITPAKMPELTGSSVYFLDVYGTMRLIDAMQYTFAGQLRFRANGTTEDVEIGPHRLPSEVYFDGIGAAWNLQDSLHTQEKLELINGTIITNNHNVTCRVFQSNSGTSGRGLQLGSSVVTLTRDDAQNRWYQRRVWNTDFSPANVTLDAGTSTIRFVGITGGGGWSGDMFFGSGMTYHNFEITRPNTMPVVLRNNNTFNKITIQSDVLFRADFTMDTLVIGSGIIAEIHHQYGLHVTDTAYALASCDNFSTLQSNLPGSQADLQFDQTVQFQYLKIKDINANNPTNATAINAIDNGGNSNWSITPVTPRTLYWVGQNGNWNNVNNWALTSGGSGPVSCIPTPVDDVVFDNNSFGAPTDTVYFDVVANCRSMYWQPGIVAGVTMYGNQAINISGHLLLNQTMNISLTEDVNFLGSGNTITTDSANIGNIRVNFLQSSNYTFADTTVWPNTHFYLAGGTVGANAITLIAEQFEFRDQLNTLNFTDTRIELTGQRSYNSFAPVDANWMGDCEVVLTYNGPNMDFAGWHNNTIELPAFTLQGGNSDLEIDMRNGSYYFYGDVRLEGSVNFAKHNHNTIDSLNIYGNLVLSAGKSYIFPGGLGKHIYVRDTVKAVGNCTNGISIATKDQLPTPFEADSVQFVYVSFSHLHGQAPYYAINSIDLGNNANFTFITSIGPGQRMYWRSSGASYAGDWNNPCHWTTNPASTTGDCLCPPNQTDTAIFDQHSYTGLNENITVNGASNVGTLIFDLTGGAAGGFDFEGNGTLTFYESFFGDNRVDFNFYGDLVYAGADTGIFNTGGMHLEANLVVNSNGGRLQFGSNASFDGQIVLSQGQLALDGYEVQAENFLSDNAGIRTFDISNSTLLLDKNGGWPNPAWRSNNVTNFNFVAYNSKIILNGTNDQHFETDSLRFDTVVFDNANNELFIESQGNPHFGYLHLKGFANIQGNNWYDGLEMAPGKTYVFESGSYQRFSSPNGFLIAEGNPSDFIIMESDVSDVDFYFFKDHGVSICTDYIKVKDNEAQTNDPSLAFSAGNNSDNINNSATGVWAFTRAPYVMPEVSVLNTFKYLKNCQRASVEIPVTLSGTGPYLVTYDSLGTLVTIEFPATQTDTVIRIFAPQDTTYRIVNVQSYDCYVLNNGNVLAQDSFVVDLPEPDVLAVDGEVAECNFYNENTWVTMQNDTSNRVIVSVKDDPALDADSLGRVWAKVNTYANTPYDDGQPFLPRAWHIIPENNSAALVRFYFTQTELDSLKQATGNAFLTPADLAVTKYPDGEFLNNWAATYVPQTASGVENQVTTTPNTYFVEVQVSGFSSFVIHEDKGTVLPVDLLTLMATTNQTGGANIKFQVIEDAQISHYLIEKSYGNDFDGQIIASLPAKGPAGHRLWYQTTDPIVEQGQVYYRLHMVDADGRIQKSEWVSLGSQNQNNGFELWPVPAQNTLNIATLNGQPMLGRVQVITLTGAELITQNVHQPATGINIGSLPAGYYLIRYTSQASGRVWVKSFIKK